MQYIGRHLGIALRLAPLAIILVISAEGVQHIIEWQLGMYNSRDAFIAHQGGILRLTFGFIKALSVVAACYFVPTALSIHLGIKPTHGSFAKDFMRKIWDPRDHSFLGLIAMLILVAPLIFAHMKLSEFTIGHTAAPLLLLLDSVLIGVLALFMGLSIWAGDVVKSQTRINPA